MLCVRPKVAEALSIIAVLGKDVSARAVAFSTVDLGRRRYSSENFDVTVHFNCYQLGSFAPVIQESENNVPDRYQEFLGSQSRSGGDSQFPETQSGSHPPCGWYRDYESCM